MNGFTGQPAGTGSHGSDATAPGNFPVYSCFDSTNVLICGYKSDVVEQLRKVIEEGGGAVGTKASHRWQPHMIVCGSSCDSTYREARKLLHNVPVVTKDWVEACVQRHKQLPVQNFAMRPLAGAHVCITNFAAAERAAIQQQAEAAGANFSAELHKDRCTHLICKTAAGAKYKAARDWGTCHLVQRSWLEDSLQLGYAAAEEAHLLTHVRAEAAAPAAPEQALRGPTVQPAPLSGTALLSRVSVSEATTMDSCQQQQQQQEQAQHAAAAADTVRGRRTSSRSRVSAGAAAAGSAQSQQQRTSRLQHSNVQQQQQQEPQPVQLTEQQIAAVAAAAAEYWAAETAPDFLEQVVLWWCGVPPDAAKELQNILHFHAGVRFPDLDDLTSHIMIGAKASTAELALVWQFLQSCRRRVEVVSPAWLHACKQQQCLVLPDASTGKLNISNVLQQAGTAAAAAGAAGSAAVGSGSIAAAALGGGGDSNAGFPSAPTGCGITSGVFSRSASSRHGVPLNSAQEAQQQQQQVATWVPEYWAVEQQPKEGQKVFEGCYFTLVALQGSEQEHSRAMDYIRRNGGQLFTSSSVKPPQLHPKVFAVCPPSLPQEAEQALAGDSAFRAVHSSCYVTVKWLDVCVRRHQLVHVTLRTPLFAPLRHSLPLQGYAGVRVFVTGYPVDVRPTIHSLVQLLGGTVADTLARSNPATHLVVPRWGPDQPLGNTTAAAAAAAAGDKAAAAAAFGMSESTMHKVHFAQRHGMQMVTAEWLVECAHEGRKLQELHFRPAGELELLPAAAAFGGTQGTGTQALRQTQLGGATQAPVSRQGSFLHAPAAAGGSNYKPPSQQHRLANTAGVGAAPPGIVDAADTAPASRGNCFAAITAKQQQEQTQTAQHKQLQQQQQQQRKQQVDEQNQQLRAQLHSAELPSSSMKTPRQAAAKQQQHEALQPAAQQQQQQHLQHDQQQQHEDPALADVGNRRKAAAATAAAAVDAAAAAPAAGVQTVVSGTAEAASAAAAEPPKDGSVPLGGSQVEKSLMDGLLTMFGQQDDVTAGASQQVPVEMLQLAELPASRGRLGASAAAFVCSAGSGGGSGPNLRSKRRAGSSGCSDDGCTQGQGSGGVAVSSAGGGSMAGPAAAAKRHRRSAAGGGGQRGSTVSGAMPPPARLGSGRAAAGSGGGGACSGGGEVEPPGVAGGAHGSRYGTRRAAAGVPADVTEMSQQVGYDVVDHPDLLLAAAPSRRRGAACTDEDAGAKDEMLARMRNLRR